MRINRMWALAALGMLLASAAISQVGGNGSKVNGQFTGQRVAGVDITDTSTRVLRVDASWNLKTSEAYPLSDQNLTFSSIISSTITAASADSSAVLDTHRMRLGMLLIKANPVGGGTGTINRLAVQIRVHLNGQSDTSSTFAIYQYGATAVATAGALPDTISFGHLVSGSTTTPWSGEFDIMATAARSSPISGGGSNDFRSPNGIAIPLQSLFGRDSWAPYVSVRVRNITGPSCAVTVHLVGTPL